MNIVQERTIALAGVVQACAQVQSLARRGEVNSAVFDTALQSILVLDAVSTPAIYAGIGGVHPGLRTLSAGIMSSAKPEDIELLRYVMSILHLQSHMYRNKNAFGQFAQDVERLSSVNADELPKACAELYQQHVSGLRPQIIVQGEENFLQRDDIPEKIRALLLAAFRSAVLWQQKGGSKFKMMWERTRMSNAAQALLNDYKPH